MEDGVENIPVPMIRPTLRMLLVISGHAEVSDHIHEKCAAEDTEVTSHSPSRI